MPQVGNRKFAYTAAGIRQAMKAAKNMKRRPTSGRPLPRPRPGTMRPRAPRAGNPFTKPLPPGATPGRGGTGFRVPSDPMPLPRPRVPNKTTNTLNSVLQRKSLMDSLQKIRGNAQPNRKQYQGPVQLTPQPGMRQPNPNIPDRNPNRGMRQPNPNIPGREPNRRPRPIKGQGIPNIRFPRG